MPATKIEGTKKPQTFMSKIISKIDNLGSGGANAAKKTLANRAKQLEEQERKALGR